MAAAQPFETERMPDRMSTREDHSDDAALAGEYVLHLLEDAERAAFEKRLADEPGLRDLVREWEAQFAVLSDAVAPVPPPPRVKAGLEKTLFPVTGAGRTSIWGILAGGIVAAFVAVGAVLLAPLPMDSLRTSPTFTANVAAQDGSLVVAASFIADTNTLEVTRQAGGAFPGRVLELWLIAEGVDAPLSLGVLPEERAVRIDVPPAIARQLANGVLAISDEPPGGSPTGAPTGAVLATGPVSDV